MLGPFLISVVAEITELWVENSQKANCRGVASIRGWGGGSNGLGNKIIDLRIIMEIATLGYIVMRETKLDQRSPNNKYEASLVVKGKFGQTLKSVEIL